MLDIDKISAILSCDRGSRRGSRRVGPGDELEDEVEVG